MHRAFSFKSSVFSPPSSSLLLPPILSLQRNPRDRLIMHKSLPVIETRQRGASSSGLHTVKCGCGISSQSQRALLPAPSPSLLCFLLFLKWDFELDSKLAIPAIFLWCSEEYTPSLAGSSAGNAVVSGRLGCVSFSGSSPQAAGLLAALVCILCLLFSPGSFGSAHFDVCCLLP